MSRSMRLFSLIPLLFAAAYSVAPAQPQEPRRHFTSRGTVELGGSISFMAAQPVVNDKKGETVYTLSMMPYVGYFVIDGLEVGLNPAGLVLTSANNVTVTQLRILLAPSYNFRTTTVATPFIEGLAGVTSTTTSVSGGPTATASGFTWGGRAGIKVSLVERGLLNLGIQYLQITQNPSGVTTRNGSNEFSVIAGWTVWL